MITASLCVFTAQEGYRRVREGTEKGLCHHLTARAITAGRELTKIYKITKETKLLNKFHGMRMRRHLMKTVEDHFLDLLKK